MTNIEKRIGLLRKRLKNALSSKSMGFNDARCINSSGVYVIFVNRKPIYVGKTTREGKKRLGEMASDFRSHTLNRKLVTELLNKKFGLNLKKLKNKDKGILIAKRKVTKEQFVKTQKEINNKIRNVFKIKFIEASGRELIDLEHFAIAVLSTKYNN